MSLNQKIQRRYKKLQGKQAIAKNTVVNEFPNFTEVVVYKQSFNIFAGENKWIDLETGKIINELFNRSDI